MQKENFVLFANFHDKHEFERARNILTDARIHFWASNSASSVNYKVPDAAFTDIELHVAEEDVKTVEDLLAPLANKT